ncbi:MAG TPA: bifunctional folylpolyglutamate synthase/dihydrofolate synthase [Epsilonproteobacteria bacterium]|nr:bifunctional folylpolyglutamate synthase/dihydrofolate synthase [Campylobacterota bacterium]
MTPSLNQFLDTKPLYYKEIDTARIHKAYEILKPWISLSCVVHIVGTNGKGSTGRIISHLASKQGLDVGHYTSPHIFSFNERMWQNGEYVDNERLDSSHQKLFAILGKRLSGDLSYFEYATLLALVVFEKCDLIVLEAGLGGVDDATNVVPKDLSIITPIGFDHQAFLGDTITQIARAKLESIDKRALLAKQPFDEVVELAYGVAKEKKATLYEINNDLFDAVAIKARQKGWADFLIQNTLVALKALRILDIRYDLNHLDSLELFGRFYPLLPNVRIDVGHNILAAIAIEKALSSSTVLIYNSLEDKPFEKILEILKPKLKKILIIPIETPRALNLQGLIATIDNMGIEYGYFGGELSKKESYLVFGSFYTVEAFLTAIGYHEK